MADAPINLPPPPQQIAIVPYVGVWSPNPYIGEFCHPLAIL
ncbi:hypothetical protein [Spirulina sp. 06S082]|nr:hypothetical protein [Spirulina sp. 06S082]MEA5469740.1 hypothetical protein [Spirulina sp. 06S082]